MLLNIFFFVANYIGWPHPAVILFEISDFLDEPSGIVEWSF